MGRIDENQEVVARIQLAIDAYDRSRLPDNDIDGDEIPNQDEEDHARAESHTWRLGALDRPTTGKWLENFFSQDASATRFHKNFDANLKEFLIAHTNCNSIHFDSTIKVSINSVVAAVTVSYLEFNIGANFQMYLSSISILGGLHPSSRYPALQSLFSWTRTTRLHPHQYGLW